MFGMAFRRNLDKLLELITKIITQPNFTNLELLQTLINAVGTNFETKKLSHQHNFLKKNTSNKHREPPIIPIP